MVLTVCRQSQTHALPLGRSSRTRLMMALQVHLIYRDVTPSPLPPTYTYFPPPSPLTPSTPPPLQFSHCFPKPQGVNLDSKISGKENNNNNSKNNTNNRTKRRNTRFYLQSPHCAANCLQHVRSSGQDIFVCKSRAAHQALTTCNMLCALWYKGTVQR